MTVPPLASAPSTKLTPLQETIERLYSYLDENPEDWDARLILADALEESGPLNSDLAAGYRWMGLNHRCAVRNFGWHGYIPGKYGSIPDEYSWWRGTYRTSHPESNIEESMFVFLCLFPCKRGGVNGGGCSVYTNRREAEDTLARAYQIWSTEVAGDV